MLPACQLTITENSTFPIAWKNGTFFLALSTSLEGSESREHERTSRGYSSDIGHTMLSQVAFLEVQMAATSVVVDSNNLPTGQTLEPEQIAKIQVALFDVLQSTPFKTS